MFELDTEINYVFTLPLEFIGGGDGMVVEKNGMQYANVHKISKVQVSIFNK